MCFKTDRTIIPSTATGAAVAPCAGALDWRAASPTAPGPQRARPAAYRRPSHATARATGSAAVATRATAVAASASATGSSDASRATAAGRANVIATAAAVASVTATANATRAPAPAQGRLGPAIGSE